MINTKQLRTATNLLTAVDVFLVVDINLHKPDQHARQDSQEVQVCSCFTHLTMERKTRGRCGTVESINNLTVSM